MKFDGFLTLYQEGRDEDPDDEESRRLPQMSGGEKLAKRSIAADQHFTEPPPRYSEASLVKRLEELGIGRPSTYASILQVLKDRKYVRLDKRRLFPEDRGRIVVAFLESFFARYVEYDFTAGLEDQLDLISNSEVAWRDVLREFWRDFIGAIDETKDLKISQVIDALDAHAVAASVSGARGRRRSAGLPDLQQRPAVAQALQVRRLHRLLELSGMPLYPLVVGVGRGAAISASKKLGEDPETGLDVTVRGGRFGPYLQLGEAGKDGEKPKRAGLPKGVAPERDRSRARHRFAVAAARRRQASRGRRTDPRRHRPVRALCAARQDLREPGIGRGRVHHRPEPRGDADRREEGQGSAQAASAPIRAVRSATIRAKGGPIVAKKGRYGPYVSHDGVNATLPADKTPETITLEEAAALIDARADRGPAPHARPRKAKRAAAGAAARPANGPPQKPAARNRQAAGIHRQNPQENASCRIIFTPHATGRNAALHGPISGLSSGP